MTNVVDQARIAHTRLMSIIDSKSLDNATNSIFESHLAKLNILTETLNLAEQTKTKIPAPIVNEEEYPLLLTQKHQQLLTAMQEHFKIYEPVISWSCIRKSLALEEVSQRSQAGLTSDQLREIRHARMRLLTGYILIIRYKIMHSDAFIKDNRWNSKVIERNMCDDANGTSGLVSCIVLDTNVKIYYDQHREKF